MSRRKSYNLAVIALTASLCCGLYSAEAEPPQETEAQTIAKCIRDLASDSVDVRHRAVLVLGKYSTPPAVETVIGALKDPDEKIRQSALVSLTERSELFAPGVFSSGGTSTASIGPTVADAILAMLADSSVQVRRLASSNVQLVMMARQRQSMGMGIRITPQRIPQQIPQGEPMPARSRSAIFSAFSDEDAVVRKNMVKNHRYFRGILTPEMIFARLKDEDRDVRILALDACREYVGSEAFSGIVRPLVNDPDRLIRLKLCGLLKYGSMKDSKALLETLAADKDFEISTEASISLFGWGDGARYTVLRERLDDNRIKPMQADEFIQRIPNMPTGAEEALKELITHRNSRYRQHAIQIYSYQFPDKVSMDFFLKFLEDSARSVRDEVARLITGNRQFTPEDLAKLISSKYPDVRLLAARQTHQLQLSPEAAHEILAELLIDDAKEVRLAALQAIAVRRLPDWQETLVTSLDEDDLDIRREAVQLLLMAQDKTALTALADFVKETDNPGLKTYVFSQMYTTLFPRDTKFGPLQLQAMDVLLQSGTPEALDRLRSILLLPQLPDTEKQRIYACLDNILQEKTTPENVTRQEEVLYSLSSIGTSQAITAVRNAFRRADTGPLIQRIFTRIRGDLQRDKINDPQGRSEAYQIVRLLGVAGTDDATALLLDILSTTRDERLKEAVFWQLPQLLAEAKGTQREKFLTLLLASDSQAAISTLRSILMRQDQDDQLKQLIISHYQKVLTTPALDLRQVGQQRQMLSALLSVQPSTLARSAVNRCLSQATSASERNKLYGYLGKILEEAHETSTSMSQLQAVSLLGEIKTPEATAVLAGYLKTGRNARMKEIIRNTLQQATPPQQGPLRR